MAEQHIRFRYPHMLPRDKFLWDRFLAVHGTYFERFDYDIRVGEGIGKLPGYPENIQRLALALTQKRIDAVGYRGDEIWVFEIKPHAGLSAVGQVLSYETLWNKQFPSRPVYRKAIVTDFVDNDIRTLCNEYNIRLFEVG